MGSQVRIIGGLLSPRAPPRTLSNSREPARARRGRRREFPAGRPAGRECKVQPLKTGCEARCKVQQGATRCNKVQDLRWKLDQEQPTLK